MNKPLALGANKAIDGIQQRLTDYTWSLKYEGLARETAYHCIPYLVAATLMEGMVTLRSYNEAHLWNPELRALMKKIEVVES